MVLFRKSYTVHSVRRESKNLPEFKMTWINNYCGTRIRTVETAPIGLLPTCYLVPMSRRNRCAWCSVMRNERMDTKMACSGCSTGSGQVYFCNPAQRPCWFLAHKCSSTKEYIVACAGEQKRKRMRSTVVTPNKNFKTISNGQKHCIQLVQHMI